MGWGIPKKVTPAVVTSADTIATWTQADPEWEQSCVGRPEEGKAAAPPCPPSALRIKTSA